MSKMPFSNAKNSCYPKIKVSAFQVARTQYRGLVITARNGRRCTQHCLAWGALALCCAVAITASPGAVVKVASLIFLLLSGLGLLVCSRPVYQETVLVLQSVGIQVAKVNRLGLKSSYFLPFTIVKDVVINETISMYSVVPYLAVLLNKPNERDASMAAQVMPLFEDHSLKYAELIPLYQEIQALMH